MNYNLYREEFEHRAKGEPIRPVSKPQYDHYTKLNFSRTKRWEKKGELLPEVKKVLHGIDRDLDWILITEPWCGDAAHTVPFIQMMVAESDRIQMEIYLRDEYPELMEKYHTNGSQSIPKLVVRDRLTGEDLFVWGPRPKALEKIRLENKEKMEYGELNNLLQKWYNEDEGISVQQEILEELKML
ncbi:MAG: thioredoxin family protein [Crocinitomicaceae bacterium]|nr:thioredoxin family protein [Crocinitomicaceae bacterium]